ncbi:MAG TPA: flagellar hook-basal body complex protein [Lacipirellulaceae bacterium]|nr:flagellar hook-basal body complex protein [Lacipirellulaceae bacterium]
MGLQSAMQTALTGMQGAETMIDVVGNNVANANTVGFKESNVLFATQFMQTQSIGSAPSESSGGTNPRQIGLGVKVSEIAPDFTQGTIEISSNPLDLAIQGDGFFIVAGPSGEGQQFYTRNGQLKTNSLNELVTSTGHRVMGYGIDDNFVVQTDQVVPLTIPFGGSAVAQETNNVTLLGNLLPNDSGVATTPGVIESVILSDNSVEFPTTAAASQVIAPPAAGTAAAQGPGTGSVGQGTYSYRVVFVDSTAPAGNNEGSPSVAFGNISIPVAGTDSIQLNNLPTAPDPAYTTKRIYRINSAAATPMYELVTTLPEAQLSYTDTAADGTLGAAMDTDSVNQGGNYSYFVTFYDSVNDIESRPAPQTASIAVNDVDRRIRLDNLPTPTDPAFNQIRIYRNTISAPDTYYLVDTLPSTTTTYIDNSADANIAANPTLDQNGPPISNATLLDDLTTFDGTNYVDLFEPGTLRFTGAKGTGDGLELAEQELVIDGTTTVLDLLNFMEASLGIATTSGDPDNPLGGNPGGSVTGTGQLQFESNAGEHNAVHVPDNGFVLELPDGTLQEVPLSFLSANGPTDPIDGAGTTTQMVVYDSLGIPMTVRLSTVLESTTGGVTTYRWFATSPDNQQATGVDTTIGTGLLTFDNNGQFQGATNSTVSINRTDVASNTPVSFDLDFSLVTALSNQSGAPGNLQMSSQDGFPAGSLSSFQITESGLIKGVYTNGVSRDLGQIVMARFINNNGLQQIGDSLWAEGVNSGEPLLDTPGNSGIGSLTAGAVELSNTDIGANLIELILASTQYRGSTRVITSAQQLLDELLAIRR